MCKWPWPHGTAPIGYGAESAVGMRGSWSGDHNPVRAGPEMWIAAGVPGAVAP